jgi:SAM-dependent methyltransferase
MDGRRKRVLNAGSGPRRTSRAHAFFPPAEFEEVRIDVEAAVAPDLLGSFCDMRALVADESFDALWSSHSLEHLDDHQVLPALREFRRVLKPSGFAIVTCPNLSAIVRLLSSYDLDEVVYASPAGPIRALDMLYGHAASIAAGHAAMAHRTAFTVPRMGRLATDSGFAEARVVEDGYDLWAVLMTPDTNLGDLTRRLRGTPLAAVAPDIAASESRHGAAA